MCAWVLEIHTSIQAKQSANVEGFVTTESLREREKPLHDTENSDSILKNFFKLKIN